MHTADTEIRSKIEVLTDLEPVVAELMKAHEAKRILWFPSELLNAPPDEDPDRHIKELRKRAEGISSPARVALALNLLTEEGLPHFHRILAVYLGNESHWKTWNNLWTAEEDRHGVILHDYTRDAQVFDRIFDQSLGRDPNRPINPTGMEVEVDQLVSALMDATAHLRDHFQRREVVDADVDLP